MLLNRSWRLDDFPTRRDLTVLTSDPPSSHRNSKKSSGLCIVLLMELVYELVD
jgi:hypothetical protein